MCTPSQDKDSAFRYLVYTHCVPAVPGQGPGKEDRGDLLASGRPCSILGAVLAEEKLGIMGPRAGRKGSPQHPALSPHPGTVTAQTKISPQKEEGPPDVLSS